MSSSVQLWPAILFQKMCKALTIDFKESLQRSNIFPVGNGKLEGELLFEMPRALNPEKKFKIKKACCWNLETNTTTLNLIKMLLN